MERGHGELKRFCIGEDLFVEDFSSRARLIAGAGLLTSPGMAPNTSEPIFHYGRMFRRPNLQEYRPDSDALIQLGLCMEQKEDTGDHPNLPAGYTYLGQFIDHDVTFMDPAVGLSGGEIDIETVANLRSPSLDLDSVYGLDPDLERTHPTGRRIYEDDGIRLRVGETADDFFSVAGVAGQFPNDLPRGDNPEKRTAASVADERNDENLAVAQTHVTFLKFHNAVVKHLSGKVPESELFEEARKRVVQHYQWIILFDFLPRVIEAGVLEDVLENGRKHFILGEGEKPFIPVEFSAAAFRLGHSIIRESYDWNRVQSLSVGQPALLLDLFSFTGFRRHNLRANIRLPSSWIIDWARFYDFSGFEDIKQEAPFNQSRKIDTSLSSPLMNLPSLSEQDPRLLSLAVRNLLRGRLFGLPAGQSVAERLGVENPLTPEQIKGKPEEPQCAVLEKRGLHLVTPLWYYILREAETFHEGERLGPVGSRIVAETFVGLIQHSRVSILPEGGPGQPVWRPHLDPHPLFPDKPERFLMTHLLYFVHRVLNDKHINPI